MKKSFAQKLINAPYILWSAIFIVVPLFIVAYFSLTDSAGNFSLDNLYNVYKDPQYRVVFADSIIYALIATVITLIMAYPFAYFLTKMKVKTQSMMVMLVMLPMWMNLLLRTYSLSLILENNGLINNFLGFLGFEPLKLMNTAGAVILGMVYNYLPYMILPIYNVMVKIDKSLFEAAQDLGSDSFERFKRVIVPMSVPGIISGITMVFVPSVSTFYIAEKLGGTSTLMIGDLIQKKFFNIDFHYGTGASLSLVLMVLIFICITVMNKFSSDEDGGIIV